MLDLDGRGPDNPELEEELEVEERGRGVSGVWQSVGLTVFALGFGVFEPANFRHLGYISMLGGLVALCAFTVWRADPRDRAMAVRTSWIGVAMILLVFGLGILRLVVRDWVR